MNAPRAPRRWIEGFLRAMAGTFVLAALGYLLGGLLPLRAPLLGLAPFVSNSVTKVFTLGLCALYASGDLQRRVGLVALLFWAHLLSVAAMAAVLFLRRPDGSFQAGPWAAPERTVLKGAMMLDGGLLLVLALLWYIAVRARPTLAEDADAHHLGYLTSEERQLRAVLQIGAGMFGAAVLLYEGGIFLPATRAWFVALPFVTNSAVKVGTFAFLCVYVSRSLRARMPVIGIIVSGHVVSILVQALYALLGPAPPTAVGPMGAPIVRDLLWAGVALDAVLVATLFGLYQRAWAARFGLVFLRPMEFRALMALGEVLIEGPDKPISPYQIAASVDGYVARIRAKRRWVHRAALFTLELHPVFSFKAPLSQLDPEQRLEHLKTHFFKPRVRHGRVPVIQGAIQSSIRVAQQLVYLGYYSSPRVWPTIGYEVFSKRARTASLSLPERKPLALEVELPADVEDEHIEADVCVIGSGAAGATIAYRLAEQGRSVLLVERGRYVEPRSFSEDEVDMIGRLYADGVFQQTEDFRFTVLQGSCVGGSTVVNNAVCFDPPEEVLDRWLDPTQHDAGLQRGLLLSSLAEARALVDVQRQPPAHLNPSGVRYMAGVHAIDTSGTRLEAGPVEANICDCLGCGYCNSGCAYGKKLSMLDRVLPRAQKQFPGKLRIVAECEIERLRPRVGPTNHVKEALGTLGDGRTVRVRAKTFVVASGTIASSFLLRRSGIGRGLPVGRGLSFNMGAAITAQFPQDAKIGPAYDGLQISHYGRPTPPRGYVFETWWNPPVAQALNMPGWFSDHYQNMRQYGDLMAVGVLVGTESHGWVSDALTGGAGINFTPSRADRETMSRGLFELGSILLAAGAQRLMVNGWEYHEFRRPADLERLAAMAREPGILTLGSGHPQGGNAVSRDPRRGVVDQEFRVHGYDNLYVCDASVFPSSLTVNPQLTVMTLATYASKWIR